MTKRIVLLIIASMAAGVCSLAQEVRFTADPAVKKIQVLDIQSSGNCLEAYGYSVNNLNDDNLCSACAVEWDYENDVDFVFTLAEKHLGTFLMYNGYDNDDSNYDRHPCASTARLVDVGSGKVLGDYNVSTEYNQPLIVAVNKELTPCEDGKYRIKVIFGVSTIKQFYISLHLFCIKEVSFWKDNVINPVWPVGDRAAFGVRGPVKMLIRKVSIDNETKVINIEFDRDGKVVFRKGTKVDDCIIGDESWGIMGDITIEYTTKSYDGTHSHHLSYKRWYDGKGRLKASAYSLDESNDCSCYWDMEPPCPGYTGLFSYTDNNMKSSEENPWVYGGYLCSYEYEKGLMKASHAFGQPFFAPDNMKIDTVYTILAVDKYGNWTKRKCDKKTWGVQEDFEEHYTEERTIIYY